ncbi:hypothetical protein BU23DRAFT_568909 [Bimuria novae-zelandiae CBS 107.79]|uniref:Uncharacterized protein n=1 Tax=Bimuria novae-zelandiae CBS 107.79 TaxID=1447943 RepID=A0A6A5VHD8_9PLEO|nr:hypothetical protein BU23DRAFT_568909 [Bimuria novae-zelandiae CBS 107.79]
MASYTLRVFLLLASTLLVLLFSGITVILERVTRSLFHSHTSRNYFGTDSLDFTDPVPGTDTIVVDEDTTPALAILGASVLAMLLACLSAAGMWELRRVDGMRGAGQRLWCWGVLGMQAVVLGVSVGVLGWASALQIAQAGAVLGSGRELTRETWKATRLMLIPVAVSALLAMVAVFYATKQRGGASWLFTGKGHYSGFQSVYEMGPPPQNQHAPPQFYPNPQAYPQQQGYVQPVYVMPPQGFQPGPHQPAPQGQKGAIGGAQPVFR